MISFLKKKYILYICKNRLKSTSSNINMSTVTTLEACVVGAKPCAFVTLLMKNPIMCLVGWLWDILSG